MLGILNPFFCLLYIVTQDDNINLKITKIPQIYKYLVQKHLTTCKTQNLLKLSVNPNNPPLNVCIGGGPGIEQCCRESCDV